MGWRSPVPIAIHRSGPPQPAKPVPPEITQGADEIVEFRWRVQHEGHRKILPPANIASGETTNPRIIIYILLQVDLLIMFETHRSAILPMNFDPQINLWDWVDLGVDAPFFMLEIVLSAELGDFTTHRLTSNINVLRDHVSGSDTGVLRRVFLLSPGYVNGSDAFQFDILDSVFTSVSDQMKMLFKLTDGRTFHFGGEDRLNESEYTVQVYKRTPETT